MVTKRKMVAFMLGALAGCAALAAQAQQPSQSSPSRGQLEVTVLDEQNEPLVGTLVALPGHRCTTKAEGKCTFKVSAGRYPLLISKDGYRGRRVNAGVRPGEVTTTRVVLEKLPTALPPKP